MKPKIKHKFRAVVATALSFFILTSTALPASAMSGDNGGGAGSGTSSQANTPFSYLKTNDTFAWRADLYVSKNADGKIKDSDLIGNHLALAGSVLCTSKNYANVKTYIQTNFTNNRKNIDTKGSSAGTDSEGDIGVTQYTLPTLVEFDKDAPFYYDASNHIVAIDATGTIAVLKDQWGANNAGTDFKKVQNLLTHDGYEVYVNDFLKQLLMIEKGGDTFLKQSFSTLNSELKQSLLEKAKLAQLDPINDFEKIVKTYLLPVNPETKEVNKECIVEWALVLTPIYRFDAIAPFYYYPPGSTTMTNVSMSTCVALDAYWFAQWDQTSHALSMAGYYNSYAGATGINVYNGVGLLSRWLGCTKSVNNSGAPGIAAYCTKEGDRYLGVYTQHKELSQYLWSRLLVDEPADYAKRGGIAVFTTKITTPEAPVYYHTYTYRIDENDKDSMPKDYETGKYSTDDPDLLKYLGELDTPTVSVTEGTLPEGNTFSPKKAFENDKKNLGLNGLAVAAMAPQPSIKQPGAQEEYPLPTSTDYYLERVPDIIDAHIKPTNPLADTATLQTGKATPGNTADDPKEYHVMLIHVDIKPKIAEDT